VESNTKIAQVTQQHFEISDKLQDGVKKGQAVSTPLTMINNCGDRIESTS
jgi:hypothetical protein